MPTEEELHGLVEKLALDGTLDEVDRKHLKKKKKDPEWTTPRYTSINDLITAFAVGVLSADPLHKNYKVPPNFEAVLNWIAFKVREKFPSMELAKVSLIQIQEWFMEWGMENPAFRKWNVPATPGTVVGVVTAQSPVRQERDFIDLGAIVGNATVYIRDDRRKFDEFNRKFEADWAKRKNTE